METFDKKKGKNLEGGMGERKKGGKRKKRKERKREEKGNKRGKRKKERKKISILFPY